MSGLFQVGDLVFAKIRGYRPWPARVEGTFLESPKLRKYSVFFFGTSERGVCSENNVFPYSQNKAKYGRPMLIRGFQQALAEIEEAASSLDNPKDRGAIKQEEQEEQALCVIKTELENDLTSPTNFFVHEEIIDSEERWLQPLKEEMENPHLSNNTWPDIEEESSQVELKASANGINAEINNFEINTTEMVLLPLKEEIEISASNKDRFVMEEFMQQNTEVKTRSREKFQEVRVEMQRLEESTDPEVRAYFTRLKMGHQLSSTLRAEDTPCEEEEDCAAATCLRPTGSQVLWVQCDGRCSKWFHFLCEGLKENDVHDEDEYICNACRTLSISVGPLECSSSDLAPKTVELSMDCDVGVENSSEADNFILRACETEDTENEHNYCEHFNSADAQGTRKEESNEDLAKTKVVSKGSDLLGKYTKIKHEVLPQKIDKKICTLKSFSKPSEKHVTKEMSFVGVTCDKFCCNNSALQQHSIAHNDERAFKCTLCEKSYKWKVGLRRHMQCHLREQVRKKHVRKKYKCETCGKCFAEKVKLCKHMIVHTNERPYKCTVCERTYKWKEALVKHKRCHLRGQEKKKYECEKCGKFLTDKFKLREHQVVHTSERPFKCTLCEKTFKWKASAAIHMQFHVGEALHKCSVCGKAFYLRWQLKAHDRIHTGEKPFECGDCGKTFAQKGTLMYHIRIHTGEKPFKCSKCNRECVTKGDLNKHMFTHSGKLPFACKYCGKCFRRASYISEHVTRVHGVHSSLK